ncbi:NAD(+) synthase [bacterium]|nr:NAD(+) synthase [bacterium]
MSKLVISQLNTIAGDIKNNAQKMMADIQNAINIGAEIVVFPELCLIGSPLGDIAKRHKDIVKKQNIVLKEIAEKCENITVVLSVLAEKNTVVVIQNKNIEYKNSFNDYFVVLGEDDLVSENAKTVILLDNQPSRTDSEYIKNKKYSEFSLKNKVNLVCVNKVGYAHNHCFDGASRVYVNGELTARAKSFDDDFMVIDNFNGRIEELPKGSEYALNEQFNLDYTNDLDRTYKSIVYSIKEYFSKNGFSKAVLGLSGGLDSTISATLLADALGKENVVGISMPSKLTSKESKDDAQVLAENLGIKFLEVPLPEQIDSMKLMLNSTFDKIEMEKYAESTTIENLQARLRATILWSVSNEFKGMLPIATSDKSEAYIGYATVNGDMSGGFAPIIDVTKTKLFALGDYMNKNREVKNAIPQNVLEKPPGAELKINPKTGKTVFAEEANMPYEFLDEIIWEVERNGLGFDELMQHKFYYEKKHSITVEQKEEWIRKFYWKMHCAVYKWHIIPPMVITDKNSISTIEFENPIISKI